MQKPRWLATVFKAKSHPYSQQSFFVSPCQCSLDEFDPHGWVISAANDLRLAPTPPPPYRSAAPSAVPKPKQHTLFSVQILRCRRHTGAHAETSLSTVLQTEALAAMMMQRCGSTYNSAAGVYSAFKSRKRAYDSPTDLPFKKLCVNPPGDYLQAMDESSRSSFSSSRTMSVCSSGVFNSSDDAYDSVQTAESSHEVETSESECEMMEEMEAESELGESSESEWSESTSADWTEHEEDGYASEDFYAVDPDSDDEEAEPTMKYVAVTVMDQTAEMVRIRFPFTSIRIKVSDFMCLGEGDFLSDTLVDFYLNHLVTNVIDEDRFRVHVFPSVFWHRLRLNVFRADKSLRRPARLNSQFRHSHKFISQIGLFDNDFAIFPINELDHWILAIVCNLESVVPDEYIIEGLTDDGQPLPRHPPCVLMLDPFGAEDETSKKNLRRHGTLIRELIEYEYTLSIAKGEDSSARFSDETFPIVLAQGVQKPANFCDSAINVLECANLFLNNPPNLATIATHGLDVKQVYPKFSTKQKRSEIQSVIMSLCKDKDKWRAILDYHD
uniref:ULP_PROTEASE domain-containing protein n=1 Tax=Panagrellus redivivus TaxID=6233 RepID=A0A7E4WCT5_PANRE